MEYKMRDFVTREELTADNLIRCLNGYLDTVETIDKDVTDDLLLYIERAIELGGIDLANAAMGAIRVDILCRNY